MAMIRRGEKKMEKRWKKVRVCRRCGEPVLKERKKTLDDYPFVCPNCDENMFAFETRMARRIMRRRK